MGSKFVTGQWVTLLDVPKIREHNNSRRRDAGWQNDMRVGIFGFYSIEDVVTERGRYLYKPKLPTESGGFRRWWVEEEWIELAPGMTEELDKFLSEWGE